MLVNRQILLQRLLSVMPGVTSREESPQSTCFGFLDSEIVTFNEECCCSIPAPHGWGVEGAVQAAPLIGILGKLVADEVDIEFRNDRLQVKAAKGGEKAGIRMEQDVLMPYDAVEAPKSWHPLAAGFCDAIGIVQDSADKSHQAFLCRCVHLMPDYIEASDNSQICRYPIDSGIRHEALIKVEAIKHITQLGMTEFAETRGWLHFRNKIDLRVSCRRHMEPWQDIYGCIKFGGTPFRWPGGIDETLGKAEIFIKNSEEEPRVKIQIKQGWMQVVGEGPLGDYRKKYPVDWDGPKTSFRITPAMLLEVVKKDANCLINDDFLIIQNPKYTFACCLDKPQNQGSNDAPASEEE